MCIACVALDCIEEFPFILIFNRDESFERPTSPLHWWGSEDQGTKLAAGCDLMNQGTWLGVNTEGVIAVLTNYWEDSKTEAEFNQAPSEAMGEGHTGGGYRTRGSVPLSLLQAGRAQEDVIEDLRTNQQSYKSFNLLYGNIKTRTMHHLAITRAGFSAPTKLPAGVHCIGNKEMNSDWDKVQRLKREVQTLLSSAEPITVERLMCLLSDTTIGAEIEGLDEKETAIFVRSLRGEQFGGLQDIGTVSSTVVLCDRNRRVTIVERSFERDQSRFRDAQLEFTLDD